MPQPRPAGTPPSLAHLRPRIATRSRRPRPLLPIAQSPAASSHRGAACARRRSHPTPKPEPGGPVGQGGQGGQGGGGGGGGAGKAPRARGGGAGSGGRDDGEVAATRGAVSGSVIP